MHAGCSLDYYIEYRKVLVLSGRNFLLLGEEQYYN